MAKDDYDEEVPPPPDEDVFHEWARGPGRAAYFALTGELERVPVLVGLGEIDGRKVTVDDFIIGERFFPDDLDKAAVWQSLVTVVPIFRDLKPPLDEIAFLVASVDEKFFFNERETSPPLRQAMPLVLLLPPVPDGYMSGDHPLMAGVPGADLADFLTPPSDTPPDCAITAVIDDGIAFANERFRTGNTSRIAYLWVQAIEPDFGTELTKGAIDALFAGSKVAGIVDEDEVYRRAGVLDYARPGHKSLGFSATHGTAVMDIAAGRAANAAGADRPIIAVQLPTEAVRDTSLDRVKGYILLGLWYVFLRSLSVAFERGTGWIPLVVNISFGNIAGPHDGTDELERRFDGLLRFWRTHFAPVEIVLPSGNSHLSRCHAQIRFAAPHQVATLPWRVLPDDRTISELQIWMPCSRKNDPPRVRLRVVAPGGGATDWLDDTGDRVEYHDPDVPGSVWLWVVARFVSRSRRVRFQLFLEPTAPFDTHPSGAPKGPIAPSGVWTVELENLALVPDDAVEAWIQRDDTPFTYERLGRQSFFDADCYRRFDDAGREIEVDEGNCAVKRAVTINAIATGHEPVVIGGVVRKERVPAKYSAGGPVSTPCRSIIAPRTGPDAVAVCEDSLVHRGVLAAGTRSGSVVALNGTSVAAPGVARWIVDRFAAGNPAGRPEVQGHAHSFPLPEPPDDRVGGGYILRPPMRLPRFER